METTIFRGGMLVFREGNYREILGFCSNFEVVGCDTVDGKTYPVPLRMPQSVGLFPHYQNLLVHPKWLYVFFP